ncbi:MAG: hypothetical protein HY314_06395 [Acidobacteria bacterium]|nr:hypothetical protein [Acidobacteriota bacterium]
MKKSVIYIFWLLATAGMLVVMQQVLSSGSALRMRLKSSPIQEPAPAQRILPELPTDPDRAPQPRIDEALYARENFFGIQAHIERPTLQARENMARLIQSYPRDPKLRLLAAQLDVRLGQFERANEQMRRYVELEKHQPNALKTLAVFYDSRAQFADEIRTLMELARQSPVQHRSAIYDRVITLARHHRPVGLDIDQLYREMIDANPDDFRLVQNYIEDLVGHHRDEPALTVIRQFRSRFPESSFLLTAEANLYLKQNRIDAAVAVYEQAFQPLWPQSLVSDYLSLLKRVGRYRAYRRGLRQRYESGTADFQIIARLFSLYVSEGNGAEANRVLQGYEKRRKDRARERGREGETIPPSLPQELQTLGAMYASIGNYDQASRYYYTLHLTGFFQANAALREDALQRLFHALMQAQNRPTRVAAEDLSLYKDIATVDQNPGMLNGVLSLILAHTNIPWEFEQREAQATRLFNSLLAYRIFEAFKEDHPASKHLPQMYLAMIDTFVHFKRNQLAAELGQQFLARYPNSPGFESVALEVAEAYRALKDYQNERQIYQTLLDRLAANHPADEPLMPATVPP